MQQQRGVATQHPGYAKFAPKWKRCRDVSDGQDAVHAAGTAYLPRLKDQTNEDYTAYVKRAGFYNATWRTMSGLVGMLFRKPPSQKVPAGIEDYLKDVDLAGTSLDTFARGLALETLEVGRYGILVDHPPTANDEPLTVAAAQQQGLRPALQLYRAESIINWKHRRVRNRHVISQVVLEEIVSEPDGEFAEKDVTQYRVLDLDEDDQYRVRVFQRENEKDVLVEGPFHPLMNGKTLDYIPFAIGGVDGIESDLDEPPLIDLMDRNLEHYRVTADYRHALHFSACPMLMLAGVQIEPGEKVYVGSTKAIIADHPDAKGFYIEPKGQGLPSIREALNDLKQEMAVLGARMIAEEKKQAETATTAAIHRTGENSVLSAIAIAVSEALEWALGIFAEWAGQPAEVEYQLNRDFLPEGMDPAMIQALMGAVQAGKFPEEAWFELAQRADLISPEMTFEEYQQKTQEEAPDPARPDADPREVRAA